MKCYTWLTVVAMSFILGLLLIQPIKIVLLSCFFSIIKSQPRLEYKRIPEANLINPYDEKDFVRVLMKRMEKESLYYPTPKYRLEHRAKDIKYHMELRKIFIEVSIFVVFVVALCYIIGIQKSSDFYYSTNAVKKLFVDGAHTGTMPLTKVHTYRDFYFSFIFYMNHTLLPALYGHAPARLPSEFIRSGRVTRMNSENFGLQNNSYMSILNNRRSTNNANAKSLTTVSYEKDSQFVNDLKSLLNNSKFLERPKRVYHEPYDEDDDDHNFSFNIPERSWTRDVAIKLIGKPRLRQIRVKNNSCNFPRAIESRLPYCFADLTRHNEETRNFTVYWKEYSTQTLTEIQKEPWQYSHSNITKGIYLIGKISNYAGGGYVLPLAKNIHDSYVILDFLDTFWWIDARTRVVIIEFTLYCVNVNLFTIVHLIAERSSCGYFVPNYQIDTVKLLFLTVELQTITIFIFIIFLLLLFLFTLRQAIKLEKTSVKLYFFKGHPWLDINIIVLGFISLAILFLKHLHTLYLLKELEVTPNYEYITFAYAAIWDKISMYVNALLVALTAVKLIRILGFKMIFHKLEATLHSCKSYFIGLGLKLFIIILAFAMFFHLCMIPYDYHFSTFGQTFSFIVSRIVSIDDSFQYSTLAHTPWFIAPLLFVVFFLVVSVIILVFFTSVLRFHFSKIQKAHLVDKYGIWKFIKFLLIKDRKTDILRLRGGTFPTDFCQPLRIRGGGNACMRLCTGRKDNFSFPPKDYPSREIIKRHPSCFSVKKVYDFSNPYQLKDSDRFEAMKRITKSHLEIVKCNKKCEREKAMKAMIGHYLCAPSPIFEEFYVVVSGNERNMVSARRLIEMKNILERYSLQRQMEKYRSAGLRLIFVDPDFENYASVPVKLRKKMHQLRKALREKIKRVGKEKRKALKEEVKRLEKEIMEKEQGCHDYKE